MTRTRTWRDVVGRERDLANVSMPFFVTETHEPAIIRLAVLALREMEVHVEN